MLISKKKKKIWRSYKFRKYGQMEICIKTKNYKIYIEIMLLKIVESKKISQKVLNHSMLNGVFTY